MFCQGKRSYLALRKASVRQLQSSFKTQCSYYNRKHYVLPSANRRFLFLNVLVYGKNLRGRYDLRNSYRRLTACGRYSDPDKIRIRHYAEFYSSIASAERITELEEIKDDIPCAHASIESLYKDLTLISFKNVSFKYDKDPVLENADVTINKGEFIAVGGDSGIGKSTMFKLMTSVLAPDKGEIVFDTKNGTAKTAADYRGIFAYVPQTNMLVSGSIFENIAFFDKTVTHESAENAAKLACIYDTVNDMPNGFDTVLGEGGAGLSEGQIQRIAIARAIAANLPIILLDEATSALDSETEKHILNNLKGLKNKTIIAISHRPEVFNICTAVITIENGKMKKEMHS